MTEPLPFTKRQEPTAESAELREFMMVFRQALLMIVKFIEKRYCL
jgi:hypothetical protein